MNRHIVDAPVVDETIDAERLRQMLLAVCAEIIAAEERLCAADRAVGDGDHGIGMRRGFAAAQDALEDLRPEGGEDATTVLGLLGRALIGEMGGASGVMFGLMFSSAGPAPEAGPTLSVAGFAACMRGGLETVMSRGGARVGDKTMVDAFLPAVEALEQAAGDGQTWTEALAAAAGAASAGADSTRAMTARFGKARTLGERALGHPDPGALSVSLIFAAMAGWATSPAGRVAGRAASGGLPITSPTHREGENA